MMNDMFKDSQRHTNVRNQSTFASFACVKAHCIDLSSITIVTIFPCTLGGEPNEP